MRFILSQERNMPGQVTTTTLNIPEPAIADLRERLARTRFAALILGPTGVAYDAKTDLLHVASTNDNTIFAVPHAGSRTGTSGTGAIIFQDEHLRGPLALVFAPNGDLLTANGDAVNPDPNQPSEIVEFTKEGKFVTQFNVDAAQGGAFGIGVARVSRDVDRLVVVDDNANDMTVFDREAQPGD
jgi:DNA-binding beta-propeller fold protein YncE